MMDGEADEPEMLSLEFDLPDAPEKVWRALTQPTVVARWIVPLGEPTDERRYHLLDTDTGNRVSYRWSDGESPETIVTFSIATNAIGGTRLRIVHSDLGRALVASAANSNGNGLLLAA